MDLGDLMGGMSLQPGTWFHLLDSDTQFSKDRVKHPWVFPDGWDPGRRVFGHALPRSTSPPRPNDQAGIDYLDHDRHGIHGGVQCRLDKDAWIQPVRQQVSRAWVVNGKRICEEPSNRVLGRIQTFDMDYAK